MGQPAIRRGDGAGTGLGKLMDDHDSGPGH